MTKEATKKATTEAAKKATTSYHNRLAVVFDFDDTLAPSSYDALLKKCGLEPEAFRRERVKPLADDGWDDTLARFYCLIKESNSRDGSPITRELIEDVGREIEPFDGVPEMFDSVRARARELISDVDVEFYLLTCGFVDIHRATPLAEEFDAMWGSEFHFNERGEIEFAKQIITYPEKVRYVLQMSKGLGTEGPNAPQDVYRDVPDDDLHVPLSQVIYVGDGGSDMPTFALLNEHDGKAIGLFKADSPEKWSGHSDMHEGRRVQNLAPADYSEDSELMRSLMLSVESICKDIQLRKLGAGE